MAWVATAVIGSGVLNTVGGLVSANAAKKAASGARAKPLDIDKVISDARTSAAENYKNSIALEAAYNPAQAALRGTATSALTDLVKGDSPELKARQNLLSNITGEPNKLLASSADSILEQLALGGSLSPETQNLIVRSALQRGAQSGIANSGAVRGLVARDLGMSSLALQQQRQQAGMAAGQALSADAQSRLGLLQNIINADASRVAQVGALSAANPLPESGLSAGSIASMNIGENNAQNQSNANYYAAKGAADQQRINSLLGFGTSMISAGAQALRPKVTVGPMQILEP